MASKTAVAIALAAAFCADGATAYHTSLLPHAHVATARQRMSGLRGPRGGTLTPMKMSFVPDKEAIKKNFAKVPDAIVLRDPVQLTDPTTKEKAEIYMNGACLTSYVTGSGYDVLFRRPDAVFDGSKPISGLISNPDPFIEVSVMSCGVPICWPQFGPGNIQQHGFARNCKWECVDVREESALGMNYGSWTTDQNKAVFELRDSPDTRKIWNHVFQARYEVELKGGAINLQFRVENKGWESFDFTCALHTYFAVDDIDSCSVEGLEGASYLDKTMDPPERKAQVEEAFTVGGAPVERIYTDVKEPVILKDGSKQVVIKADSKWKDIVLWNPYGNDSMGYKNFICIENGVIEDPITLKGGEMWWGSVSYIPTKDGLPAWAAALADA